MLQHNLNRRRQNHRQTRLHRRQRTQYRVRLWIHREQRIPLQTLDLRVLSHQAPQQILAMSLEIQLRHPIIVIEPHIRKPVLELCGHARKGSGIAAPE